MRCFAIGCPLSTATVWKPSNCMRFVTAPQPVKEFIYQVYDVLPTLPRQQSSADQIYDSAYAPNSGDGNQFPIVHPTDRHWWINTRYSRLTDRQRNALCFERIYMAMNPAYIKRMFEEILCPLADNRGEAIVVMKRCVTAEAHTRPDSVVVYTSSSLATRMVLDYIRSLLQTTTNHTVAQFTVQRPVVLSSWFRPTPPGGTREVGIPGIGVAQNPQNNGSFGERLCGAIGDAVDSTRRLLQGGEFTQLGKTEFACIVLGMMQQRGLDPSRPWDQGRTSPSVSV